MATKSPGRGRPKKRPDERKEGYLDVRLESSEKEAFKAAADLAGLPLSTWVRERLRSASRKELLEAGQKVAFLQQAARRSTNG